MIYLVSNQSVLFDSEDYKIISIEESLELLNKADRLQYDSETTGKNPHLNKILFALKLSYTSKDCPHLKHMLLVRYFCSFRFSVISL